MSDVDVLVADTLGGSAVVVVIVDVPRPKNQASTTTDMIRALSPVSTSRVDGPI